MPKPLAGVIIEGIARDYLKFDFTVFESADSSRWLLQCNEKPLLYRTKEANLKVA